MTVPEPSPRAQAVVEQHCERLGWRRDIPAVAQALGLIGSPGSRWRIPTPALVVDLDRVEANLALMRRLTEGRVALRPHAKSHKSAAIAQLQLAAGAVGVCCAKLAEAEALAAAGVDSILITSPVDLDAVQERVVAWLRATPAPSMVLDRADAAAVLAGLAARAGRRPHVLVDIDVGLGRTGVADAATAVGVASAVAQHVDLTFAGVQAYGGHWQHLATRHERREATVAGMGGPHGLVAVVEAIDAAVGPVGVRSGGGTGTLAADLELAVLNELQPGSFVFMDRQYADVLGDVDEARFSCALTVQATVVSANRSGWVTLDAGLKAFATDAGAPVPMAPHGEGSYVFFGDEHGMLAGAPAGPGDRVELMAPHCDPTVDRYDVMHVVRDDCLIGVVPVDARGRSQ